MFFFYGFGFLTMEQTYFCLTESPPLTTQCDAISICSNQSTVQFRVNSDSDDYVVNWIQEMDLMCTDRTVINYMEVAYFVSYGCAGLFLFPVPDRLGCKKTVMIFGTLHCMA